MPLERTVKDAFCTLGGVARHVGWHSTSLLADFVTKDATEEEANSRGYTAVPERLDTEREVPDRLDSESEVFAAAVGLCPATGSDG
mmetsp:Transcript_55210/g.89245  ORF Transcript_55210/g.89245 Transcript_55210/m.89245 type:complete len:86 (-) Transcript_55210:2169-2426(-)